MPQNASKTLKSYPIRTTRKRPKYVTIKNGHWVVKVNFPTNEKYPNGRPIYLTTVLKCDPETPERARAILEDIRAEHNNQIIAAQNNTFAEFIAEFVEGKRGSVSDRTFEYYTWLYDKYVKDHRFGTRSVHQIGPRDIQSFYRELSATVSAKMIRKIHTFIGMAFVQGLVWEAVSRNPCRGVILPRVEATEIEVLTQAEARTFMKVCMADFPVFAFALETAARPGEYLSLRWSDVDFEKQTVSITRSVSFAKKGGGFKYTPPKTTASKRTLRISDQLCDRLRELQLTYKRKAIDHDLVFPSERGSPMRPQNLGNRDMKLACKAAGIPGKSLYSLRHTCATLMLAAGVDVKTTSAKLGHASIQITLDTYSHVLRSMEDSGVVKLAEALY